MINSNAITHTSNNTERIRKIHFPFMSHLTAYSSSHLGRSVTDLIQRHSSFFPHMTSHDNDFALSNMHSSWCQQKLFINTILTPHWSSGTCWNYTARMRNSNCHDSATTLQAPPLIGLKGDDYNHFSYKLVWKQVDHLQYVMNQSWW